MSEGLFTRSVSKAASSEDVPMHDSDDEKDAGGDTIMKATDWVSDSDPPPGEPLCASFFDTDVTKTVKITDRLKE